MRGLRCGVAVLCLVGLVGLAGCAPPKPVELAAVVPAAAPEPLPPSADGIAFVRDGAAFVVSGGSAGEIAADGATKVAVGYSADGGSLLVTEERGTRRVVLMAPASTGEPGSVVLDHAQGSTLGGVRAVPNTKQLFSSIYGDPATQLVVSGLAPASKKSTVPLQGAFSGEFDVDATGAIAYTGSGQNPATVMLRTGTKERPLAAGLALAFTPAFSRDGARVCFTGSEKAAGPISVWVVDRASGTPRLVAGTENLKPMSPVFSPDGRSIAFRSAIDGSIWVAPAEGGEPRRLPLTCDEAPIGW